MEDSSHSSFAMLSSDHGHQNVFLEHSSFERNIESGNRETVLLVYLTAFLLMFQSQRESSIHFWLMGNTEHHHHEYFLRHKKSKVTEKKVSMEGTGMGRQVLFQGINRRGHSTTGIVTLTPNWLSLIKPCTLTQSGEGREGKGLL